MSKENTIWGIHLEYSHGSKPVDQNYVAIGWAAMGDLGKLSPSRDAFKAAFARAFPSETQGARESGGPLPLCGRDARW